MLQPNNKNLIDGSDGLNLLSYRLKLLMGIKSEFTPVVLCIGSDRVTGDCLGPLTGHILTSELNATAFVYGSLEHPITAINLVETYNFVKANHCGSTVIAVDSSLGQSCDIGKIRIIPDGIYPGAATGKNLPKVGDISITATVAQNNKNDLYGVRLGFIYPLAKSIAEIITLSLTSYNSRVSERKIEA